MWKTFFTHWNKQNIINYIDILTKNIIVERVKIKLPKLKFVWFFFFFLKRLYYNSCGTHKQWQQQPKKKFYLACIWQHVNYFLSVKYFQVKTFLGKENIFKCLVAFWKLYNSEKANFLLVPHIFSASKQIL